MLAAGRPWSPPLHIDPEQDPMFAPTPAFFSANASHYRADSDISIAHSNDASSATGGVPALEAFSHIPPGSSSPPELGAAVFPQARRSTVKRRPLVDSSDTLQGSAAGSSNTRTNPDEPASTSPFGTSDRPSAGGTRFVRHEDAGEVTSGGSEGGLDEEVVDLPPLYQDVGPGIARAEASDARSSRS